MINTAKHTLQKFTQKYKHLCEKRNKGKQKHLLNPEQKTKLIAFLNRYSLMFHYILACSICFLIEVISRHSFGDAFAFMFDRGLAFLYNSLIVFTSLHLVYFFRRRALMRTVISVLWLFLGTINGCVLLKRVTPFTYTDVKLINDLFTMKSNYFSNLEAIAVILLVVTVLVGIVILWKKGPKYQGKQNRLASTLAIGLFAFLIPMVTNAAVSNNILADYFENIAQGYKDYGFVYSFSASVVDQGMTAPPKYSQESVDSTLAKMDTPDTDTKELPNMICVLLESFLDPKEVNFLNLSENPIPNFDNLYENFSSGYLTVPVVGAGTANTEFEILTGMGMQFFGLGEYPYKTILKSNSCESIASDLGKNLNYGTHVVHNNGGNFYSRRNAFTQMGFDSFISKEMMNIQEYTPLGTWPTDNILIGEVQKALDSTEQQDFIYTITVQGHGAYPAEQVIENPEITVTGAPDEAKNNEWEYYVNQLHEVDKFIADLIDMLSARDEKTMVVFFGDHLPTMGLTNEDMKSGDIFKTKYATWNNFGAEKVSQDLTSYQLLASITDQANIHEGTMFSFHQNHNYNITDDYSKDMELLQYDILCGKRYAYHGKDLYPASMLQMGVQDITADQLEEQSDGLHIYGANYTKWSKVFVNGVKVPTSFLSDTELVISMGDLKEGTNVLTVNQMGSSDTIFRSSNEISYLIPITPDAKPVVPVDDTIEETPSSIDRAVNSERNEATSEELDSQINSPSSSEKDTTISEQ
ncbi:MAG: sulfatase-like hydrolase/transferase [Lachnospiraceae bacterium]|jgi:phosphoglycerol transferase MdoB-like AlkP superfamily enzyme|nr:sulfatase-like hydrolase/transferase [Lachnospiraceae bacterium]